MTTLVIINGNGGVGKSSFVDQCRRYCQWRLDNVVVEEISMVDFVKVIATMCEWQGEKTEKARIFLAELKRAMEKYNDLPVRKLFEEIEDVDYEKRVYFVNSRELDDVVRIEKYGKDRGFGVVRVLVKNDRTEVNEVPDLIEGIQGMKYDYVIDNCGTLSELYLKAGEFINALF